MIEISFSFGMILITCLWLAVRAFVWFRQKRVDVKRELQYFVEVHGDSALTLGASSSIAPGVPPANLDMLIEGLAYYRTHKA